MERGSYHEAGGVAGALSSEPRPTDNHLVTSEQPRAAIGAFTVLEDLGRGAAAQVFRVRREGDPVEYALKLLMVGPDEGAGSRALRREAALLAGVDHPGLVRIHEVGEHAGRPYLVMDLVEGRPLSGVLADGALAADRVIALGLDLTGPLAAVHRRGLVHRDLKPDNIMILADGRARLIDFGLADRPSDTVAGTVGGTLAYAAPEQTGMLRLAPDHRCDLYSLGVVLFECLAGRPPFVAADVAELLRQHASSPPPDLTALVPGVPAGLAAIVATLLAKDPDDRYDDAVQLADDLARLAEGLADAGHRAPADAEPFVPDPVAPRWTGAARRRNPLVGRREERDRLRARFDQARAGVAGRWSVVGPAGLGKSALAAELAAHAEEAGALVLHGRCAPDDVTPLAPLRSALAAHVVDVERLPGPRRDRALARLGDAAGVDAPLIAGLAADLSRALGVADQRSDDAPADAGPDAPTDAEPDRFDLAVVGLLVGLAQAYGGLLLVLDDAQWLDPVTVRVLARLEGELDDVPMLVLLLARAEEGTASAVPGGPADVVLGPLPDPDVAELVRAALPGAVAGTRLVELLVARSSGSPLVAHEYLQAVVDAGLLRPHWGDWSLDEEGLQALALPQDAVGLLLARLRRLPPGATDLLATAAVVGLRFRYALVAAVHGVDPAEALAAAAEAARHGLVEAQGEQSFGFVHEALRRALLDGLDPDEAARRHLRVAAVLEAEPDPPGGRPDEHVFAVAHHYLAGGAGSATGPLSEAAFAAFHRAGLLALRDHASARAVEFLRAAHGLAAVTVPPDDERTRSRLALRLGVALHQDDAFEEAERLLAEALAGTRDPLDRAEILGELADLERATWRPERAVETVRRGLAELGAPMPRGGVRLLASTLWVFLLAQVMRVTGWRFGTAQGSEVRRCRTVCQLHGIAAFASLLNGSLDLVAALSLRSTYWAGRIGRGQEYLLAQLQVAFLQMNVGRVRAAERAFTRLRADEVWQDPTFRAVFLDVYGSAFYFAGRDQGEKFSDALLGHGRWLGAAAYRDGCDALTLHEANAGRTGRAVQWGERGARRVTAAGEGARTLVHRLTGAMLDAVRGRPAQAAATLREVEGLLPEPCPVGIAVVHRLAELVLLREQDETGERFDRAVAAFEELGLAPRTLLRFHRIAHYHVAAGRLAQARRASDDERPARLAQADAALKVLRRFHRDPDLRALERTARAELLVQRGDPRGALRALAETDDADRHDVPLAAYEAARVRARAMAALRLPEECDRQARIALAVADEEGWPHRAAWVVAEFGRDAVGPSRTTTGPSSGFALRTGAGSGRTGAFTTTGTRAGDAQLQLQRQRLQALQQVSLAASRVVEPAALARISLDRTIQILAAERAFLFLTDEQERLVPFLGRTAAGEELTGLSGYSASLVERVHAEGQPLVVTGTEEGAALGARSVVLHGLRSIVIAPLRLEQRRLGVVYLDSQVAKGIFTSDDVDILTALTTHIATSLETARAAQLAISVQTARRERDLAERLREASQALAGATSPAQVLVNLLEWAGRLVPCDAGWVVVRGPDGDRLFGVAGPPAGEPLGRDAALDELLAADRPLVGSPADRPAVLRDALGDASWIALPLRSGELEAGAVVLRSGSGSGSESRTGGAGDDGPSDVTDVADVGDLAGFVDVLVAQAATAYDRAQLFARVQALAVADELTGVANRRHFFDVARRDVETSLRAARPLAALMVDIDLFKAVNDTYGHPTGDDVIRTVAQRLAAELRSTDLLGRYGGEEFAVVMPDTPQPFDLAERLRVAIASAPVPTRSGPLPVTVSIGLARLAAGDDLESLLARADRGLYGAKQDGRNRVGVDRAEPAVVPVQWDPTI